MDPSCAVRIDSADDPRVAEFRNVPDPERVRQRGIVVAEGRFVVRRVLHSPVFRLRALLVTETALDALALDLAASGYDGPLYVTDAALLRDIGGYAFHQGCLGLVIRPESVPVAALVGGVDRSRPLVVLERVGNPDNIGGVFRNAAAFGAGAVLLSPGCGDPLYRKAVRTSIGTTLAVPYAVIEEWPDALGLLREGGRQVVALTPEASAFPLDRYVPPPGTGVVLVLGNEGEGLTSAALDAADLRVGIPVDPPVDSLNIATTAAIVLHHLRAARHRRPSLPVSP